MNQSLRNPIDPFTLKSLPRWHPRRAIWTAYARVQEKLTARLFSCSAVPIKEINNLPHCPETEKELTSVTGLQLSYLISGLKATEVLASKVVVEVGSFRGATTLALATNTQRQIFAVDPYIGYGGAEQDCAAFQKRVRHLSNVRHLRMTSGEAARTWSHEKAGFVFIDAVHDFVNTNYDITIWGEKLAVGGLMALHDTDNSCFPGTRRAAFEALKTMDLWAHINDLVILKKR